MRAKNSRPAAAVFAYSEVGYVCLRQLLKAGANVVIVFTHNDAPGEAIWFRSVAELALEYGIPVRSDEKLVDSVVSLLRDLQVELIFSLYYRAMIPIDVLNAAHLGAYNMHGALLPRYRGRACVNWAVLNGETETGATLHVMTEAADKGDIVDQERVPILFEDTSHDVFIKVAEAARKIISRSLLALEAGSVTRIPQDEAQATKFGRRRPEDGLINWNKKAVEIYNQVRALTHPFPGAFTVRDGLKMFIWKAYPTAGSAAPGEIVSLSPFLIGTGEGLLEILSYQIDGEAERSS